MVEKYDLQLAAGHGHQKCDFLADHHTILLGCMSPADDGDSMFEAGFQRGVACGQRLKHIGNGCILVHLTCKREMPVTWAKAALRRTETCIEYLPRSPFIS